jgi:hypothetical protein
MGNRDVPSKQKILENDPVRNAILQALRKYFDHPVHGGNGNPVNSNEKLIITALRSYFKREGWS